MTTNLSAIAGPSRQTLQPKVEPTSPINPVGPNDIAAEVGVSKHGLTVGENGEVQKVPPFLNKLYR
jgi:heat shock transcription factor